MTAREREAALRISGGLLNQAVLSRNAAAILTEHTLLPLGSEMGEALRVWAGQLEDWAAELDELVLHSRIAT